MAEEETYYVAGAGDVTLVKRKAKQLARDLGLDETASEECAIAVAELASNIVKHAHYGSVTLSELKGHDKRGIEVVAQDRGPGIVSLERSFSDGYSSAATMGAGLGAVNRLMHQVDITSDNEVGTLIRALKWAGSERERPLITCPFDIGAATQSCGAERVNGDAFVIKHWQGQTLVAIIDGVGHGEKAHQAAAAARHYIEHHHAQALDEIFVGTSRACRTTRGVVMALMRLNWRTLTLHFASIGNIETRSLGGTHSGKFLLRRGIVGHEQMPRAQVVSEAWTPGTVLVLHTDGVMSRWRSEDVMRYTNLSAAQFSTKILKKWAKANDDATVIVIKEHQP